VSAIGRDANLLGALALVVTDRTSEAVTEATGLSDTAAAALSALHHFLDRPTLDTLRQVLGLTASGAVRLVDRLVEAGYATRGPGVDGRSRAVTLTAEGRRAAERAAGARAALLDEALDGLSADERETLYGLLGRVMGAFVRGPGATRWICRLCDTGACGRDAGLCPTANAALARADWGSSFR
jgi:DNA-binding MarR family transcriptional regulator